MIWRGYGYRSRINRSGRESTKAMGRRGRRGRSRNRILILILMRPSRMRTFSVFRGRILKEVGDVHEIGRAHV